jgi:hypothetical protein
MVAVASLASGAEAQNGITPLQLAVKMAQVQASVATGETYAVRDLGCRPIKPKTPWSAADADWNTEQINAWYDAWTGGPCILVIDKNIAVNDTLGKLNETINKRTLPSQAEVRCLGGSVNGIYYCNYWINESGSSIVYGGPTDRPLFRLSRYGNHIKINAYGYPFVWRPVGHDLERTRCCLELVFEDVPYGCATGKHTISLNATGFLAAAELGNIRQGHADETLWTDIATRDCKTLIKCSGNQQAIGHHVVNARFYPSGHRNEQAIAFDWNGSGKITVDNLSIVGDYGCTVVDTTRPGCNGGSFNVNWLQVDRALVLATRAGRGYFRLLEARDGDFLHVWMRGHIAYCGEDLNTNWLNLASGEPVVKLAPIYKWAERTIKIDVAGLPNADRKQWLDFRELGLNYQQSEGAK